MIEVARAPGSFPPRRPPAPPAPLASRTATSAETIERAAHFYDGLGKRTIRLKKEVPGHVANRLAAALFREVVHLVSEEVVSVADVDTAICWGPGLRWGIMGPVLLYHLGGGAGGIDHFWEQFTGPMTGLWQALGAPDLTAEPKAKISAGVIVEAGGRPLEALEQQRDDELLGLLAVRQSEAAHA